MGDGPYSVRIPKDSVVKYKTALKQDQFLLIIHGTDAEVTKAKDIPESTRPSQLSLHAGEVVKTALTNAPGNGAPLGGLTVIAGIGWFAARPSGTENIYAIYGESFLGPDHLRRILEEAATIVNDALVAVPTQNKGRAPAEKSSPESKRSQRTVA